MTQIDSNHPFFEYLARFACTISCRFGRKVALLILIVITDKMNDDDPYTLYKKSGNNEQLLEENRNHFLIGTFR